ncbi:hypothetical protein Hanom_Chr15g01380931 [Helianthus anomalus]
MKMLTKYVVGANAKPPKNPSSPPKNGKQMPMNIVNAATKQRKLIGCLKLHI